MVPYRLLWSTCVTYRMPCYSIGQQVFPTQLLPREAEDFPRGSKYPKDVPLSTYLDNLQQKDIFGRFYLC